MNGRTYLLCDSGTRTIQHDQVVFPEVPNVRYEAESDSQALICLDPGAETFSADLVAEILNESYSGCSVSLAPGDALTQGSLVICRVGTLAPLRAEVVWCRAAENDQVEAGLRYID